MATRRNLRSNRRRFDAESGNWTRWLIDIGGWLSFLGGLIGNLYALGQLLFLGLIMAWLIYTCGPPLMQPGSEFWGLVLSLLQAVPWQVWLLTPVVTFGIVAVIAMIELFNAGQPEKSRGRTVVSPHEARDRLRQRRDRTQ